jgi:Na+/melibiose symporter-like transporter
MFSLVEKVISAIALVCLGFFLDTEGFVHSTHDVSQPHSAVVAIAIAVSIVPSITGVLSLLVIYRWGLRDGPNSTIVPRGAGPLETLGKI